MGVDGMLDAELDEALLRHVPDRAVARFFAPAAARAGLGAVYAFDYQLASVAGLVSTPLAGQLRLAWWREQVDAIHGGRAVQAPVPVALAAAVRAHGLPRVLLDQCIDAHETDLVDIPFSGAAAFRAWADGCHGSVVRLAGHVLGCAAEAERLAPAAAEAGAWGQVLQSFSRDRQQRRFRLPLDWLQAQGLVADEVFDPGFDVARLTAVLGQARSALGDALRRLNAARPSRGLMPALSPLVQSRFAGGAGFDPLNPAAMTEGQRLWRIVMAQALVRI